MQRKAFRSFQAWTQSDPDEKDGKASDSGGVLPLDLIQPDPASILSLKKLWAGKAPVYLYYLTREIFPKATPCQTKKLSACAQELASPSLFKVRLGFSGTPSNILPSSLPLVEFDGTTDGKTMAILSSPHLVQIHHLKSGWTPQSVLRYVANRWGAAKRVRGASFRVAPGPRCSGIFHVSKCYASTDTVGRYT